MNVLKIKGFTRELGKAQGFIPLPVKDDITETVGQGPQNTMTSSWEPTPAELEAINAGAPIYLTVWGTGHPPVALTVGPIPETADAPE